MLLRSVLLASALSSFVASLSAQVPVTVRCTPTDGSAAGCYYCPGFEHVIKLSGVQLHSSAVNLLPFHDLDVVLHGTWNGSIVEVASVQLDVESFSIGGTGRIGHRFDFTTLGPVGALAVNCMAFGASFTVPAGDLALQLNPLSTMVLGLGAIGTGGELKTRLDIPDDVNLIGLRVFGQGLVVPAQGLPYTTNLDAKVIN